MRHKLGFVTALVLGFALAPSPVRAGKSDLPDMDFSRVFPDPGRLQQSYIPASPTGEYQMRLIADKFAAVFTNTGVPIAIFDLSLNPLSLAEVTLGGFGMGDLSVLNLMKLVKEMRRARQGGNAIGEAPAQSSELQGDDRIRALKQGEAFFKDIRLSDAWASRNGISRTAGDDRPGVQMPGGASFTLADLEFKKPKHRATFQKLLLKLANALYPEDGWNFDNVHTFATEMEFRYVDSKPGYDLVLNRAARPGAKPAKLPGVVVNYLYPYENLAYKYTYAQIDRQAQGMKRSLGPAGVLIEMFFARVCHGLIERIDNHERQLIALLEAQERFEYAADLPSPLVDISIDLLYLGAVTGYANAGLTDAAGKRASIRAQQEIGREKVLKKLAKHHPELELTEAGDGKFLIVRKEGKFHGILSSALGPHWLARYVSSHVSARGPLLKIVERNATEIAGMLARAFIPRSFSFKLGKVGVAVSVEPMMYELFFRGRLVAEQRLEGELASLVDEALAGRYSLPLSRDELGTIRKSIRATQLNPYEVSLDSEKEIVAKNLVLLKQIIASKNPGEHFRYTNMLPMVH